MIACFITGRDLGLGEVDPALVAGQRADLARRGASTITDGCVRRAPRACGRSDATAMNIPNSAETIAEHAEEEEDERGRGACGS